MVDNRSPGGAGPIGGLLFIAVLIVLGWVVISTVVGIIKWLIGAAIILAVVSLGIKVLSRS